MTKATKKPAKKTKPADKKKNQKGAAFMIVALAFFATGAVSSGIVTFEKQGIEYHKDVVKAGVADYRVNE